MSEPDDPVVNEVDVYLSKQLAKQLYLLQYPVRPSNMTYDDTTHLRARVKPEHHRVEMEVSLNTRSDNYSKSKGEQIAINVDGAASYHDTEKEAYYTSNKMDKQVLDSSSAGVDPTRFAVGCFHDGDLHLNTLESVLHLRPSFNYLDKADKRLKVEEPDITEYDDTSTEPQLVAAKFGPQESEFAKARRFASYGHMHMMQEKEAWIELKHHNITDPNSDAKKGLLTAQQTEGTLQFQMEEKKFFKNVIPAPVKEVERKTPLPSNVLSLAQLRTMPLLDQVRALLINTKVIRYSQLLTLLPTDTDPTVLVRTLQQVAVLVQGCWVVKSDILYPKDTLSPYSGVPAEAVARARDYVLWRFTHSRCVVRKEITAIVKLPAEDVHEILKQMSKMQVNRGWEFCLEYDLEFVQKHQSVVQRQHMLWDAKFTQFSHTLKLPKSDLERRGKSSGDMPSPSTRRRRNSSRTKSCSERSGSDTDTEKTGGRRRSVSGTAAKGDEPKSKIKFTNDAANTNGITESNGERASLTPEQSVQLIKELGTFIHEKLSSRHVASALEVRRLFTQNVVECPSGHLFTNGVTDAQLLEAAKNVGIEIHDFNNEVIYVMLKYGDKFDPIRQAVYVHVKDGASVQIKKVKQLLEEQSPDLKFSDADVKKILNEICNRKGNSYSLKCREVN